MAEILLGNRAIVMAGSGRVDPEVDQRGPADVQRPVGRAARDIDDVVHTQFRESLTGTREPLYLVNRPGNAVSHSDGVRWIDQAIACVGGVFRKVLLRGDTAFSLTEHLDRWDERVGFVFGYDAYPNLVGLA